jgi:DNA mismatch repair protein MutS
MGKAADKASATPVMRQFLAAKAAHPDALVFFRMGDFYELFFADAVEAARALDLTLTARNKGSDDEIPMAGVPHHAASGYVQRLLDQGFKVAICEQMADPATVKGLVPREVVRVVSPGIAYDDAGIEPGKNLFVVAVEATGTSFGVAALDVSTGELAACEAQDLASAIGEVTRLDPRELLVGPGGAAVADAVRATRPKLAVRDESSLPMTDQEATAALDAILGEGEAGRSTRSPLARRAAARAIAFARAAEPGKAPPVERLRGYDLDDTLVLDEATQAHLELVRGLDGESHGCLLAQLDLTRTATGARLLRRRLLTPLTRVAEIRRRHDAVELFVTQPGLRAELRQRLGRVADLERVAVKLRVERAAPRDLGALRSSLAELPAIVAALDAIRDPNARDALGVAPGGRWVDTCDELSTVLSRALADDLPAKASEGGVVRAGYDAELDETRALEQGGQRLIVALEARLRDESAIPSLKLRYTRVFGWYIEVTRSHVDKAPASWRRKQTVATGERFTCDELDALADKLAHAEDRLASREAAIFVALVREAASATARLHAVAETLSAWDVASALAEVAQRDDHTRPVVDDSLELTIVDGRHPVVEKLAAAGTFVPNDVVLDASRPPPAGKARLWLVTGPNMAGKSTLMRQAALAVILAQMGAFVPARHAHVGVVDRVLTRVGASDNLARGDSTFMVEMKETAHVLRRATARSLVVVDEIGRGTSTYDGLAIAWAVAEHLHDVVACRALFATHYHELTELAASRDAIENWSVSAREHAGDIIFLHKLQRGSASRSYGVACARLAGLPERVITRAKSILEGLESGATLPGGSPARARAERPQLDLFAVAARSPDPAPAPARTPTTDALLAVDVDRMTPLEALQLVAHLKQLVSREGA